MSTKSGSICFACANCECKNCPLYEVSTVRGLSIEVNGKDSWGLLNCPLRHGEGCPLSEVPLYTQCKAVPSYGAGGGNCPPRETGFRV